MLAEQELLEDYIDGCLRVRVKVRIALKVTLRQDSLARLPPTALVHDAARLPIASAQLDRRFAKNASRSTRSPCCQSRSSLFGRTVRF